MKRERRSINETLTRISTIAVLSALGFVLMAFAQFPYPGAPWLKIEVSEIVTIVAYALYGFPGGAAVALIKTLLNLSVHGLSGLGIGDITAFVTSCLYLFGLYLTSHVFKLFKKGITFRILAYISIAILVTFVMTILNALFITPSYFSIMMDKDNPHFSTCFDNDIIQRVAAKLTGNKEAVYNGWSYIGAICLVYIPFNLMKAGICFFVYELLFNRLIFVFMRRSDFFKKWFVGNIFTKEVEEGEEVNEVPTNQE